MRIRNIVFPMLMLGLVFLSCAVNPVTGKQELMMYTEADELAMGKETDGQVIEQYGIYQDAALTNYIATIGKKMAMVTHRPSLNYSFKVLDTDVVNAFAVPGGYVYFTRGILGYLNTEAELAGVMGHELGHVSARHSMQQLSKSQLVQLGLGIGIALSEDFQKVAGLAGFGVQMFFLKFSRDNERQADDLGVEYSTKSGYDSNAMADFFETLERMSPSDGSGMPAWFSTHPNPVDRVGAVRRKTTEWQQTLAGKTFKSNRNEYLTSINHMVIGPDPRQGFTEGNTFYHPDMKFQFDIPAGWQVANLPSQVQAAPESQDAAILFMLGDGASADAAVSQFIQKSQPTVNSRTNVLVHGFKAVALNSNLVSGEQSMQIESRFIEMDGKVFVLHGISTPDKFATYQTALQTSIQSYRRLTDPARLNVKPDRVLIAKVGKTTVLRQFFVSNGVKTDDLEKMALLNGMHLDDTVQPGMLIKLIKKG